MRQFIVAKDNVRVFVAFEIVLSLELLIGDLPQSSRLSAFVLGLVFMVARSVVMVDGKVGELPAFCVFFEFFYPFRL